MKYALVFPGQGSQSVGMLSGVNAPEVAATFDEAAQALGWDLPKLVREGPPEELNRTERTQPALLAAGVAMWRAWCARGAPAPEALAGHSLGEYTALVAAGSFAFADALRLVELRGQLMQAAVPVGSGGMAAVIGLDDAAVEALCGGYSGNGVLEPVNYNAPGQVVVAGHVAALDWLQENAKSHCARMVTRLPVSVPSHCSLMRDAAARLAERLREIEIRPPQLPVLHNLDARMRTSADAIRETLAAQLHSPVRWTQTVRALARRGVKALFECGPGKVLTGLNKRIVPDARTLVLEDAASFEQALLIAKGE